MGWLFGGLLFLSVQVSLWLLFLGRDISFSCFRLGQLVLDLLCYEGIFLVLASRIVVLACLVPFLSLEVVAMGGSFVPYGFRYVNAIFGCTVSQGHSVSFGEINGFVEGNIMVIIGSDCSFHDFFSLLISQFGGARVFFLAYEVVALSTSSRGYF